MKIVTADPVKVKIEYTYEYNKFKLVGINRKVIRKHVMDIAEAIQIRNLLHLFPVIINKAWEVMDGQHRISSVQHIEAAQLLRLPVYYIMDPDVTIDDIRLLNTNKINWKNMDYIQFYAGKKMKPYVELVAFMGRHPQIPLSTVIQLISSKRRDFKDVKNGILITDRIGEAEYVLECVYDLKLCLEPTEAMWKSRSFIIAMRDIISTGKYDHSMMMASPYNNRTSWQRQHNTRGYILEIDRIYNSDLPLKSQVDFRLLTKHLI